MKIHTKHFQLLFVVIVCRYGFPLLFAHIYKKKHLKIVKKNFFFLQKSFQMGKFFGKNDVH